VSGPIRPEATAHGAQQPAARGQPKGWLGLSLVARTGGDAARGAVASRWRLAGGKVLLVSSWGPQGGRWARQSGVELTRAAFVNGEGAPVAGSGVEGGLKWGHQWWMGGLTVKQQSRWRLDGNQRGGGILGGRSR
jgi:hypothetical protein